MHCRSSLTALHNANNTDSSRNSRNGTLDTAYAHLASCRGGVRHVQSTLHPGSAILRYALANVMWILECPVSTKQGAACIIVKWSDRAPPLCFLLWQLGRFGRRMGPGPNILPVQASHPLTLSPNDGYPAG